MGQDCDPETPQASSSVLTLDSVFDIKGPVRLVPQGGTQKPHIVLRRERLPKNADGSSCLSGTTRFSLVANKRFTISKGHTLSLGIADPTYEDELKLLGSEFLLEFDISNQLQMAENISSLPARMRKSLTGTKTYDAFAERQGQNSLGFPGYPFSIPETRAFASASVQTDPVDPVEIPVSSSTRTPPPTILKNHKQNSPLRLYPSPISVDDHSLDDAPVDAMTQSREDDSDIDAPTERSFSSMDLSTPSQSPNNSPVISPSRPGPLIPGLPNDDCFSIPPAAPEVTSSLEGSGTCGVPACAQAVKHDDPKRTESNSCSIDPVHTTASRLKPTAEAVTSPSILDSGMGTGTIDVPKMPRAMSQWPGISKALPQTKPHLSTPTPQPTISNPLGIRPSANLLSKSLPKGPRSLFGNTTVQTRVVEPTASGLAPTAPVAPRKPVVVGAKWTALRGSSSSASSQANVNNAATSAVGPSSSATATTVATTKAPTPILLYGFSPPRGEATSTIPSTSKRKSIVENNVLSGQGSLKRVRSENESGDNTGKKEQNQSQSKTRGVAEEQPRKKVKIENLELESLSSTSAGLSRETSSPALPVLSRVDSTIVDVDGGDPAVDPKGKVRRKRQREKRKAKAKMKQEEKTRAEREEKENLEKAAKLAEDKPEADKQRLAAAAAAPVLPAQNETALPAPQRIVHPLPPKPHIPVTGSSYKPGRKRERRTPSRSGGSPSRSRSRSQGRETTQARRIRSPSRSRSRMRDSPVDRQQRDKQIKPSASTGSSNAHEGVAESKQEEPTPNEARVPPMTPVPGQPKTVIIHSKATWPTTNPNKEFQLVGRGGTRVPVQQLVFSSDGKKLVIISNDTTVGIWETTPQAKEIVRWQIHTPVVAVCWLQYDTGVLVLGSDGSTDTWFPEEKTVTWARKSLFDVPFSVQTEKALSLAYAKDKIAISTTVSVKVWFLTLKGVWQPQREIKRSGVTALCFQTDGSGLFGGCRDGTLWYCEVPNGTLRAYAFLPSNKCITSIRLHPSGTQLLIGQKGGSTHLISHQPIENKGTLEKGYSCNETDTTFMAIFATRGQAVVSGSSNGCALVWDRKKGTVVYGLKHGIDDAILAIAAFDGRPGMDGMMVSGTRDGKLCWWPIPQAAIR